MYVKPVSGRRVPDPEKGGYLPEEGREVEPNVYWLRRVQDGDVTEAAAADEPKSVKKGTEQ
jgi:hypothetical protein